MRPELVRRRDLDDAPRAHHGDAVAERERLRLVVRDVHRGHAELVEEATEIVEQPVAEPAVERAERLVEEEDARLGCERARESDALLLAARERPTERRSNPASPTSSSSSAVRAAIRSGGSPRIRRPNATLAATSR